MSVEQPYLAVVSDLDGVLTRTAALHERAWKQVFDELLAKLPGEQRPFSSADYRAHVDGRPRLEGAAAFLASRGLVLPRGQPSGSADERTLHGLGERKNQRFGELLEGEGAEVYEDAVAAIERWRRGEMGIALVSASRNCRRVIESIGLAERFDAIVDGEVQAQLQLEGKRGLLLEAARRLQVEPRRAVVLEDAVSGVEAGREADFGLVVGVDREGPDSDHAEALARAGAHVVVDDLSRLRFARRIPSAWDQREPLWRSLGGRELALFLDYDGTLTPIVDDPADANLSEATRATLATLAARWPVAVVSGRDRRDVERRVGLAELVYAGNHGFDIAGCGQQNTLPEAEAAIPKVERAEQLLRRSLAEIPGAIVERKRFSVAAHYRMVASEAEVEALARAVDEAREATGLRKRHGKKVFELEPPVAWDKGRALEWIRAVLQLDRASHRVIYVGDDETDEDAFAVLRGDDLGIRIGPEVARTLADLHLADPAELRELLEWLGARASARA
ncbi:MAG: trehalose-phosphatase [Enhygromyxa sp.]